jgi:hypothetical protein
MRKRLKGRMRPEPTVDLLKRPDQSMLPLIPSTSTSMTMQVKWSPLWVMNVFRDRRLEGEMWITNVPMLVAERAHRRCKAGKDGARETVLEEVTLVVPGERAEIKWRKFKLMHMNSRLEMTYVPIFNPDQAKLHRAQTLSQRRLGRHRRSVLCMPRDTTIAMSNCYTAILNLLVRELMHTRIFMAGTYSIWLSQPRKALKDDVSSTLEEQLKALDQLSIS